MALPNLKSRFHRILLKRPQISGFTLLELLVAMMVAGIVVSGLLFLVVELLKIDRRESVLTQVQTDMQRAVDYMTDDMREAVYIYDNPSSVAMQIDDSPGGTPVLAFWRPNSIDGTLPNCAPIPSTTALFSQCKTLEIRQATYSLIIYYQKLKDSNTNWKGDSRIIRYELDKYSSLANLDSLTITPGYQDPTASDSNFSAWSTPVGITAGEKRVLVDFVDSPTRVHSQPPLTNSCANIGTGYRLVPTGASSTASTSFFGCIRDPNPGVADVEGNGNQDAYIFLRGSTNGAGNSLGPVSDKSALPTLESRVLMRGVINKNPVD